MIQIGFSHTFSQTIIKLYINRTLFIEIDQEITRPITASLGIPQGSILSSLLYVIYTYDLENMVNRCYEVTELADDICAYVDNCDLEDGPE